MAGKFYAKAKDQLPANDKLAMAQYKMLCIFLDVNQLQRIDAQTEARLVEPLNWLKDVKNDPQMQYLRVGDCSAAVAAIYLKQRDTLKASCFVDSLPYGNMVWVKRMINLINKPDKTPFEKTMVKYYPHTIDELYYHQAIMYAYDENIDKAITIVNKMDLSKSDTLSANPFNIHIQDCHDCDQAAPQKQKFTTLSFLKTLHNIKADLLAGKDKYRNALFMANAYYNISYYGNNRPFYGNDNLSGINNLTGVEKFAGIDKYSQGVSQKYYMLARTYAKNNEQRAKCTFMLAKCEHNEFFNSPDTSQTITDKYFAELKASYSKTNYYQDVLRECGYFKSFDAGKPYNPFEIKD